MAVPAGNVSKLVDGLRHALSSAPPSLRETAAQEALDVLAVAAETKPMAVLSRGYDADAFLGAVKEAAAEAGLATEEGTSWRTSGWDRGLPDWYRSAVAGADENRPVHYVARKVSSLPEGPIDAATEAALLGYPPCCVAAFHRRRRLFHLFRARAIRRQAGEDIALREKLARSGVVPTPKSDPEARSLALATRTVFAPFTSVAMCLACEENADSPARRLSAQYRRLARDHWPDHPAFGASKLAAPGETD